MRKPYEPPAIVSSVPAAGLDRYRTDPPPGEVAGRCPRHPSEERVFAAIPVRDLRNDEAAAVVQGWTCPQCFPGRSFAMELAS